LDDATLVLAAVWPQQGEAVERSCLLKDENENRLHLDASIEFGAESIVWFSRREFVRVQSVLHDEDASSSHSHCWNVIVEEVRR